MEVYVFKMYGSISYGESDFDVVFFVTREHGVIGSFITTEERTDNGSKVMISPGGYILKDHIDYSNYEVKKLL